MSVNKNYIVRQCRYIMKYKESKKKKIKEVINTAYFTGNISVMRHLHVAICCTIKFYNENLRTLLFVRPTIKLNNQWYL